MTPVFVADIGNTRIKCALYKDGRLQGFVFPTDEIPPRNKFLKICREIAESPRDEMLAWEWTLASVAPERCDKFGAGLRSLGFPVRVLSDYREIPLKVDVDAPEQVGIDRLLAAVAVTKRLKNPGAAAIVSAGTAVTIDLVDSSETFRGGVILPGLVMMAQALHDYTALLPMVESLDASIEIPGRCTQAAILAGINSAIAGAVDRVVEQYRWVEPKLKVYLTGGDFERISPRYCKPEIHPLLVVVGLTVVASGET